MDSMLHFAIRSSATVHIRGAWSQGSGQRLVYGHGTMTAVSYRAIVDHYEGCLRQHGGGARAVDWKSEADAQRRYNVMLDVILDHGKSASLLDFGCGLAALKAHMDQIGLASIRYTGLEISEPFAAAAREAAPDVKIVCLDVLEQPELMDAYDYIVMNGVFTRRHTLSVEAMWTFLGRLLPFAYAKCKIGLAFNVMSSAVDWESNELFHPDAGRLLSFIGRDLTRNYVLRNDYGLHETTLYLYRDPLTTKAVRYRGQNA